ncbi:hypothetical protein PCIT_b0416 [Pseudoalteromonas citrea]|uniref:Uncharacterized protein n=1 Tax=Pseudoalteromonas citrea TaxID=43655 RepID=A0AAD4FPX3_9GAMM|nr:hypothetical protein PCIT_b0416 [Pseudoalteromonas citrea]
MGTQNPTLASSHNTVIKRINVAQIGIVQTAFTVITTRSHHK